MNSRKLLSSFLKQNGNCAVKISVRFNSSEPLKTCLYEFHVASGGKMVDFAGLLRIDNDMLTVVSAHVLTTQATPCQSSTQTRAPWPATCTLGEKNLVRAKVRCILISSGRFLNQNVVIQGAGSSKESVHKRILILL